MLVDRSYDVIHLGDVYTCVDHSGSLLRCGGACPSAWDRNLPNEIRGGASPLIQLIRGLSRTGQDVTLLCEVAPGASAVMSASLPARVCIASESI